MKKTGISSSKYNDKSPEKKTVGGKRKGSKRKYQELSTIGKSAPYLETK